MNETIFLLIFAAIGVLILFLGASAMQRSYDSKDWPTTEGKIFVSRVVRDQDSDGDVTYRSDIQYVYEVNGQVYDCNRIQFGWRSNQSRKGAQQEVAKYPPDSTVTVHYNPKNPKNAVLEAGKLAPGIFMMVAGFLVILTSLIMWVVFNS
jgi:hypothetical protein